MPLGNGLNPVYPVIDGPHNAIVNIVFVHGLFGHPESTWSDDIRRQDGARSTVFWPKDLLPQKISNCNVYSYGYDADIGKFLRSVGLKSVHGHGRSLMVALSTLLLNQGNDRKPILFVAHSLGGLVVKEALNQSKESTDEQYEQVVRRTLGVIFLGTPHRGSSIATLGRMSFRLSEIFAGQRNNINLVRALERNSDALETLTTAFTETLLKYPGLLTFCFWEEKETRSFLFGTRIVDPTSAKLDSPHNDSIHADHRNMAKFSNVEDLEFGKVCNVLKRWLGSAEMKKQASGKLDKPHGTSENDDVARPNPFSGSVTGGRAIGGGASVRDGVGRAQRGRAGGGFIDREAAETSRDAEVTTTRADGGRIDHDGIRGGDAEGADAVVDWSVPSRTSK